MAGVSFREGFDHLAAVLRRIERMTLERDRKEIACERCGYWPCVCGDPEFETWNSQQLDKAAERE